LIEWITKNQIGDFASIFGVFISVVGFTVTIVNVWRSKSAADRAEYAAIEAQRSARLFSTVADTSKVISMMEEVKKLNRSKEWTVALDRYNEIKKILISIKSANPNLEEDSKQTIQSVLTQLSTLENLTEKILDDRDDPESIARFNKTISSQTGKIMTFLVEIQSRRRG